MNKVLGVVLAAGKGSRMNSELPKVLHTVNDVPMVVRGIDALKKAGVEDIVVVVGYRAELVREALGDTFKYATQENQLGTGDAVRAARNYFKDTDGKVVVIYGDAPLLSPTSIKALINATDPPKTYGALLTITLSNPPAFGRIVRGENDTIANIVEERDCTPEQLLIEEVNVGVYCFEARALYAALDELRSDNAQQEYYLTDIPAILAAQDKHTAMVSTQNILEALGVNDQHHLKFAEQVDTFEYAESVYDWVDVIIANERQNKEKNADRH